ncbi:T9SS type A sorting domain-containing protein [Balneola sp. MJW-20]|uniref:T9SS type A sorting domain-containing protein n=1 Tax=Gracilimonas aurantiaca TaxID=3234185 RepID=UPI00346665B7
MKTVTIKLSAFLLAFFFMIGSSVGVQAQTTNADLGEEFIFFIDGVNVQIPTSDGFVVNDPLNPTSGNKVYEIRYADWGEAGFRWPTNGASGTVGANMSAFTGTNYGETDTLYFRIWVDPNLAGKNEYVAFLDTEDGNVIGENDLPFRMWWTIPAWARDGQWHDIAVPLPPRTSSALDSAKVGKNLDGTDLAVEVDTLFKYWSYAGAWGNGNGVWDNTDPNWQEFDWESVKYAGRHTDHNTGGGNIYFDYFSVGVPPSELVDTPPAAPAGVTVSNADGVNTVSWAANAGVGGYDVYFSETPITDVGSSEVTLLASLASDAASYDHEVVAPHETLAGDITLYYAVTAKSDFGAQSDPGTASVTGNAKAAENYAYELTTEAVDAVFDAILTGTMPDAATLASFFPESYVPFQITEDAYYTGEGGPPTGNADLSTKHWIGFEASSGALILYSEVTDDILSLNAVGAGTLFDAANGSWNYDSIEMGIGNYSPASFFAGSTHSDMERGDDPDYQFRLGGVTDGADTLGYAFENFRFAGLVDNSESITEATSTGWRVLTYFDTAFLAGGDSSDVAFSFPTATEVKTYPLNIAYNDADASGVRETQVSWGPKAGNNFWWNTPSTWEVVAFVGRDMVTSADEETNENPYTFSLDQNYPNPFNPTTNISFTLEASTEVTLEVFNMLGQKVATIANNQRLNAGRHTMTFDASSIASGVYLYRISTGSSFVQTRKMILIK